MLGRHTQSRVVTRVENYNQASIMVYEVLQEVEGDVKVVPSDRELALDQGISEKVDRNQLRVWLDMGHVT